MNYDKAQCFIQGLLGVSGRGGVENLTETIPKLPSWYDDLPYSGKFSREKTFADLCSAMKIFSANFWGHGRHAHALCQRPRLVKLFHESFLRKIFIFADL